MALKLLERNKPKDDLNKISLENADMTLDMMREALEYLRKEAEGYKLLLNEKIEEIKALRLEIAVIQKQLARYEELFRKLHIKITEELGLESSSEEEKQQ